MARRIVIAANLVRGPLWRIVGLVVVGLGAGAGCGTTGSAGPQSSHRVAHILVESNPDGASIQVDGEVKGIAPTVVRLPLNDLNQLLHDVELKAEYRETGRELPDSIYRLRGGAPAPAQIKINPHGMADIR